MTTGANEFDTPVHSPINGRRGSSATEESEIHCLGHSQLVSVPAQDARCNCNVKEPQDASS